MIFHLDFETDKLFYLWIIKSYKRKDYCTFCKIDHVYAKLTHFSFMMTCSCPDPDLCISTQQSLTPCVLHHQKLTNRIIISAFFLRLILTKKPFWTSKQIALEFWPRFLLQQNSLQSERSQRLIFSFDFFLQKLIEFWSQFFFFGCVDNSLEIFVSKFTRSNQKNETFCLISNHYIIYSF